MKRVFVRGLGAVSPAGWTIGNFREALAKGESLPICSLARPGWTTPLQVRPVPAQGASGIAHPRLRRTSPISNFTVAAAVEALGNDLQKIKAEQGKLGVICCVTAGCVQFSRRFYDETLRNPATASPLVFPETVFNAPASHLASVLQVTEINYTLVGTAPAFLEALALGANWICDGRVDNCVVVGVEELDWLTADALKLFDPLAICSEGAGAVLLSCEPGENPAIELHGVSEPGDSQSAVETLKETIAIRPNDEVVSGQTIPIEKIFGHGLMAGAAWRCVAAIDALAREKASTAIVSLSDGDETVGVCFAKPS